MDIKLRDSEFGLLSDYRQRDHKGNKYPRQRWKRLAEVSIFDTQSTQRKQFRFARDNLPEINLPEIDFPVVEQVQLTADPTTFR